MIRNQQNICLVDEGIHTKDLNGGKFVLCAFCMMRFPLSQSELYFSESIELFYYNYFRYIQFGISKRLRENVKIKIFF